MQLRKTIKRTARKYLEEQGFELRTEKAYTGSAVWCFTRKDGRITQSIIISKSGYHNSVGFVVETDAWGHPSEGVYTLIPGFTERVEELQHLPQEQRLLVGQQQIPDFLYHINYMGQWPYEDETELEAALWEICDVIEKYGLDALKRMSQEEEIIPTDEMGEQLYGACQELSDQFIARHGIDTTDISSSNVALWFQTITEVMTPLFDAPYSDAKDTLVEIAAFLGEQIRRELKGKWVLPKRACNVLIMELDTFFLGAYWPLKSVVDAFRMKNVEILQDEYLLQLDAKLPMDSAQRSAFVKRVEQHQARKSAIQ